MQKAALIVVGVIALGLACAMLWVEKAIEHQEEVFAKTNPTH
jgi:hypothetical protein